MPYFLPVLLLLLLITLAMGANIPIVYGVLGFLAVLYILSKLWARSSMAALSVSRGYTDRAFVGEELPVWLEIANRGRLPVIWIEMDEVVPLSLGERPLPVQVFGLAPREVKRFDYTISCRQRGYHELGPLRAVTGDLLGFETRALNLREAGRLIVYPRIVPLQRLGLPTASALAELASPSALFEDPTRLVGVRDYHPGDAMRRIHWRATARTGRLMVKHYQRAISRETLICLDLDLKGYALRQRHEAIEHAIVAAASLAHHIVLRERLPAGLATWAFDPMAKARGRIVIPPRNEQAHLMTILEVLARVRAESVEPLAARLRHETAGLGYGSTVVAITGRLDADLAGAVLGVRRSGQAVALILVQPPLERTEPMALGRVPVYRIWLPEEMAEVG